MTAEPKQREVCDLAVTPQAQRIHTGISKYMLKESYPFYLANKPAAPNFDLEVTDKFSGQVATRVALADAATIDAIVTQDEETVREWLTTLDRLPLCRTASLEPNRDYYVRVSARGRPNGESMLGWASAFSGQARFTFVP